MHQFVDHIRRMKRVFPRGEVEVPLESEPFSGVIGGDQMMDLL
jgi:hypothetical protein